MGELITELNDSNVSCDEFVSRAVQAFEELNPDQTYITWSSDDILGLDKTLSRKRAQGILKYAGRKHDGSVGINWDVLKTHIDCGS